MSFVLDTIRKKEILSNTETVVLDWTSPAIDLDDREGEFSITLYYENGSSVNMKLWLQVSTDGVNFATLDDTDQVITDPSGMHIWDISGSGSLYARVMIEVTSGSIDVTKIYYAAKQRH